MYIYKGGLNMTSLFLEACGLGENVILKFRFFGNGTERLDALVAPNSTGPSPTKPPSPAAGK